MPLLDALEISQVTTICERFGVFDLHGRNATIRDFDEETALACADAGFRWFDRGENGVRDFVTKAREKALDDGFAGLSNAMFGRFHYFLTSEGNRAEFLAIRQLIVDRLSELAPYGPDDPPLFGVRPARRYWHTPLSAERQYGVPYRTIRKKIKQAGISGQLNFGHKTDRFAVSVEDMHSLLTSPDATVSRLEVTEHTGAHAHDFIALDSAGLLVPVSGRASAKSARYRRGDMACLEQALTHHSMPLATEREGWVSVHQAYLASSWSRGEVFRKIAEGLVPTARMVGSSLVPSLRVELEPLRRLHPLFGQQVMSTEEAANLLEVSETVVERMMKFGHIEAYAQRNEESGRLRVALTKAGVLEFRRTYIPVSEIWRRRGGPLRKINPMLNALGLQPSFEPERLRCTFYMRDDIDIIFPPLPGDGLRE